MAILKSIKQDGTGDFTTIQGFWDWVYSTYSTTPPSDQVIGEIQDSNTYNETITINNNCVFCYNNPVILRSNKYIPSTFPVINHATKCFETNKKYIRVERIKFTGAGMGISNAQNTRVYNCWFLGLAQGVRVDDTSVSVSVHSSLFVTCTSGVYAQNYINTGGYIRNCTFYNCTVGINNFYWVYDYNNVYYVPASGYGISSYSSIATRHYGDYSCFYITSGGWVAQVNSGTKYTTLAAWQTATGKYAACVEADPLFENAGSSDFRLQDGSPAKSLGNSAYIYSIFLAERVSDIYSSDYDENGCSSGCYQNTSILTPRRAQSVYPLGKCVDTSPTNVFRAGNRFTGYYGQATENRIIKFYLEINALLNEDLDATETTIDYDTKNGLFPVSGHIVVDNEVISYGAMSATQFTSCVRGCYGTTATTHSNNTKLNLVKDVEYILRSGLQESLCQFRVVLLNLSINGLLNGALTSSATTINYDGAVGTIPDSGVVLIEKELVAYTGKSASQLTGCTRGYAGTIAVAHEDNAMFYSVAKDGASSDVIKDSWATGSFYDVYTGFEYSVDYSEGEDPETDGTWYDIGTGDPELLPDFTITGDGSSQLSNPMINGINNQNSNSGVLYLNLTKTGSPEEVFVDLYKDVGRTNLVASGSIAVDNGTVTLLEQGSSGIWGYIDVTYTGDDIDITIEPSSYEGNNGIANNNTDDKYVRVQFSDLSTSVSYALLILQLNGVVI